MTQKNVNKGKDHPCTGNEVKVNVKVKVKCTPVQALRLCTGLKAYRGSRDIALHFHDHGTRSVNRQAPAAFTSGKDPVPIVQEARWALGPVWTGTENLFPHRDSIH